MKKNIVRLLVFAFVSAVGVVSPMGDMALNQDNNEVIAETEINDLDSWEKLNNVAGVHYDIVDVVDIVEDEDVIVATPPVEIEYLDGWTKTSVNVRTEPSTESEVLTTFGYNQQIEYADYNEEWIQIKYNDDVAYIYKEYVSNTINTYKEFYVPKNRGFKSYEPYNRFNPKYKQYKLQQYACTGEYGTRKVDGRYCIALGTHYFENVTNDIIGTYVDLVLENGEVIPCILGDIKADIHTDANNIMTANGCLSEFIVDKSQLPKDVKSMGNMSYAKPEWRSPVCKVIVYEKNFFDEQ